MRKLSLFVVLTAFVLAAGCGQPQPYKTFKSNLPQTTTVVFSHDGKLLAMGNDAEVQVWDVAGEKVIATFPLHFNFSGSKNFIAFSPDDKSVAVGGASSAIKIFPVGGGDSRDIKVPVPEPDKAPPLAIAFSSDGKWIAEASDEKSPRVWEISTGKMITSFPLEKRGDFPRAIAFSPDGKTLAAGYNNGQVRVWDMPEGKERKPLPKDGGSVLSIAFSPDSKTFAVCGPKEGVMLYDASTGGQVGTIAPGRPISVFAFSGDGTLMATSDGLGSQTIDLWDVPSGKHRAAAQDYAMSLAFSPDNKLLANGRSDGWTKLWNVPLLLKEK